jgi:hypothetical protein
MHFPGSLEDVAFIDTRFIHPVLEALAVFHYDKRAAIQPFFNGGEIQFQQ